MDTTPFHMISELEPHIGTQWRIKVRVTRIWQQFNHNGDSIGTNMILVDVLGARIHAWIPPQNVHHMQNHIIEGQTYAVHNFIVRQYAAIQKKRCFANDIFVQFNNLTVVLMDGSVDFIQPHVFHFTNLSNVMQAATQDEFLIDVVGILGRVQPINSFINKYNLQQSCIRFTIYDMDTSAKVTLYNKMAESFDQAIHDVVQHPIIVILSSCRAHSFRGKAELTNLAPTRFFVNHNHAAVEELRDAIRLAEWRLDD